MKKLITLLAFVSLVNISYSQIAEDYVGEWYNSGLADVVDIYSNGTYYGMGKFGSWRVNSDGRLQVIADIYVLYYNLSDDFNTLIFEYYKLGTSRTNVNLKYEKFRDFGTPPSYYEQQERIAERQRKKEEAERQRQLEEEERRRQLEREEELYDEMVDNYIKSGMEFYYLGDYSNAIREFEYVDYLDGTRIDEYITEWIDSYINIGDAYFSKGKYYEAKEFYITGNQLTANGNQYDEKVQQCDEKISYIQDMEGDKMFKYANYKMAIIHYQNALELSNKKQLEINKKIASSYEKIGDDMRRENNVSKAIENYKISLNYYNNIQVLKKINNLKDEIQYKELQKYKLDIGLLGGIEFNNKSSNGFGEIFKSSFGGTLRGEYKFHRFIKAGVNLQYAKFTNDNLMGLLSTEGVDTSNVTLNSFSFNGGDLELYRISIIATVGYLEGLIKPYLSTRIDFNTTKISSIIYLEEIPNSGGAYREKSLERESNDVGYSIGAGVYIGSGKINFNLNVFRTWIDGKGVLKKFSNFEVNAGVIFYIKI